MDAESRVEAALAVIGEMEHNARTIYAGGGTAKFLLYYASRLREAIDGGDERDRAP